MRRDTTATERVAAFSDAVIAVIITIMVLDLKAPEDPKLTAILALWPTLLSYVVSYLFIAIIWINHHHLLHFVRVASPRLLWINFAHLFFVSLLPFATAWMARTELAPLPVAIYAATFVLVNGAYLFFEREAFKQADPSLLSAHARRLARRRSFVGLAIFALAALVALVKPFLGFGLICTALVLYLRPELFTRRHTEPQGDLQ
ncbi:MAG TPA: TMEM175 family protein [Steroidobacteraceae bacterium]|jgi:uncharacterized membrane protein